MIQRTTFSSFLVLIFLLPLAAQQPPANSGWHIQAQDIDPANYYGITVANGMIGLVSSAEPMRVSDVVLNGVYDYYQRGRVSNILKSFNHVNMNLDVDGRRINRSSIQDYRQVLDMKKAALTTTFSVGDKLEVSHTLMALRHLPYTALTIVELKAKKEVRVTPMSVIEAPVHLQDVRNTFSEIDRPHVTIPLLSSVAKSPSGRHMVAASNSFIFPEAHGQEPDLIHEDWDYNMHLAKFTKELKRGESYRFAVVSSATSTADYNDPLNEAERLSIFAMLEGTERLQQRHEAAWEELWKSDIRIEGEPEVQRDVRSALYHLYSFARAGTAFSLSPMGLSGLGYNGHVFWDTELWMYPPLLMLQPEIARSLLEYRYQRLDMARQNAFAHGYEGAMFPWESSDDGSEDTPVWALTGPFQHHITGSVAWAFWKYYRLYADNIPILKFADGTTRENASYEGVDIKQADVNLLAYPLNLIEDEEQIRKDLAYYEPRMSPEGPAMGNSVLATLYARLGEPDKAYDLFLKSYQPNEVPPFGVISETAGGTNPYFATGAGGMLQAVLAGFGGLTLTDEGLVQIKQQLPRQWKSLTITGIDD